MDIQLQNKSAIVTGSSSGIGKAIALSLAAEGVKVVVHGRREQQVQETAQLITDAGGTAAIAIGDLTRDEDVEQIGIAAREAFGSIDILINNAGAFPPTPLTASSASEWNKLYDQNVGSIVRMIGQFAPPMIERGWGRIIIISSIAATSPFATFGAYGATKAAGLNLAMTAAREFANTGVTVNALSPGDVLTPAGEERWRAVARERGWGSDWDEIERRAASEISPALVGRFGRPEEVGALVSFFCSPLAGYVTGSNVRMDGGFQSFI